MKIALVGKRKYDEREAKYSGIINKRKKFGTY